MIEQLSSWIVFLFIATTLFALWYFYLTNGKPHKILIFLIIYGFIQSMLGFTGFYLNTKAIPPRAIFVLVPMVVTIVIALQRRGINWMLKHRDVRRSTFLHTIRIPIEIVLHQLFLADVIPQLMTFEGRNFDIAMGVVAPIMGTLYLKGLIGDRVMIAWNVVGLSFVLWIVGNALLSIETPFQQFAFDQPNRGVLYFPFVLLPAIIVPIVIYTHITDIIKLRHLS